MKLIEIGENESGQRLDKLLLKYLDRAPKSFIFKMLRKKNITLNDKRAEGMEKLNKGDFIKLWFADETLDKFSSDKYPDFKGLSSMKEDLKSRIQKEESFNDKRIVFENESVILFNKPSGMLSQKAKSSDISANEILLERMLERGELDAESLKLFKPSVCNRLDRNTSGIIIFAKTLNYAIALNELIKNRALKKEYLCIAEGTGMKSGRSAAWLYKDEKSNRVRVESYEFDASKRIETEYRVIAEYGGKSLLLVHLISGRTHQIRAHLSYLGHPVTGDRKYGGSSAAGSQLLHSYRLTFPDYEGIGELSGRSFTAGVPEEFYKIIKGELWEHGIPED